MMRGGREEGYKGKGEGEREVRSQSWQRRQKRISQWEEANQEGINPWPLRPQKSSHRAENRCPNISLNVGAPVFIEAFSRATLKAANPKRFFDAEMVFELLLIFYHGAGKDLGSPVHRFLAVFFVLCEARVRPVFRFCCSFMFLSRRNDYMSVMTSMHHNNISSFDFMQKQYGPTTSHI